MTVTQEKPRPGPAVFTADDPTVERLPDVVAHPAEAVPVPEPEAARPRRPGLVAVAIAAAVALIALGIGVDIAFLVDELLATSPVLGWLAVGVAGTLAVALVALIWRELRALARLGRIDELRRRTELAVTTGDAATADEALAALTRLYARRPEMAWALTRFGDRRDDVMDTADRLALFETDVLRPLDQQAVAAIAGTAQITAVFTAISPFATLDMLVTGWRNLALVRRLAGIYGGRPGLAGSIKLMRRVVLYMALTGGLEAGDSLAGHVLGGGVAAKLSARLGEGVVNGLLTARIGIAAIHFCRPLPFIRAPKPKIRDMAAAVVEELRKRM